MDINQDGKLTDRVIGEAVLGLLEARVPVTTEALLVKLQHLLMTENDAEKKEAAFYAIVGIKTALNMSGRASSAGVYLSWKGNDGQGLNLRQDGEPEH